MDLLHLPRAVRSDRARERAEASLPQPLAWLSGGSWLSWLLWLSSISGASLAALALAAPALAGPSRPVAPGSSPALVSRPEPEEADLEELLARLEERDPAARRRAVRDLAGLDREEAWERVLGALADPKGEVADEAQWQLAGLRDPAPWRTLLRRGGLRHEDPLVRLRAAEAVGRSAGPGGAGLDGLELLGFVDRREPELAETLLWSVERLAEAGRLTGDRERLARELGRLVERRGESRVRAQALMALVALEPTALAPRLEGLARDREHRVRVALLEALGRRFEDTEQLGTAAQAAARGVAERLTRDEHPAVRLAALEAVAARGDREALEVLVDRLEVEPRFRLRVACMEHLQRLSGRRSKLDPRPWRLWIQGLPETWRPGPGAGAVAATDPGGTASFAGLPVLSDRVCFLVDFSGSLWFEREGRPARKGKVDEVLREALPRLPEGARFNVVPYTGTPHPWREELVPAREREVRSALEDFEACRERGSGNVFDAVRLALRDPEVDRLVILTDGAPTGGSRWKLELLVPLLAQATRFDRVAIDSVVVDARPALLRHWAGLAESTGGRSLGVDL